MKLKVFTILMNLQVKWCFNQHSAWKFIKLLSNKSMFIMINLMYIHVHVDKANYVGESAYMYMYIQSCNTKFCIINFWKLCQVISLTL